MTVREKKTRKRGRMAVWYLTTIFFSFLIYTWKSVEEEEKESTRILDTISIYLSFYKTYIYHIYIYIYIIPGKKSVSNDAKT